MADNAGAVSANLGGIASGATANVAQGVASGAPTAAPGAAGNGKPDLKLAQPPSEPRTWKVKVDGKEENLSESELLQHASLGKAAFKRMQEANALKTKAESFIEKFRQDPMAALEDPALGLSEAQRREAIEKYYKNKYIDQDKLSPAERELANARKELERYKAQEEQTKQQAAQAQAKELEAKWGEYYQNQILQTLETAGLPKTQKTVARMAMYMQEAAKNKFDAPMSVIVEQVRNDYQQELASFSQAATPETLIQMLGPDAAKKIQRYELERYKKSQAEKFAKPEPPKEYTPKPKKKEAPPPGEGWKSVSRYWTKDSK